jgi:hypothetical protein
MVYLLGFKIPYLIQSLLSDNFFFILIWFCFIIQIMIFQRHGSAEGPSTASGVILVASFPSMVIRFVPY